MTRLPLITYSFQPRPFRGSYVLMVAASLSLTVCGKNNPSGKTNPDGTTPSDPGSQTPTPPINGATNGAQKTSGTSGFSKFGLRGQLGTSFGLTGTNAPSLPSKIWGLRLVNKGLPRGDTKGIIKEADILTDGTFTMDFNIGGASGQPGSDRDDWVFLLVNPDNTPPRARFIGQLNVSSGSDGLMRIPVAEVKGTESSEGNSGKTQDPAENNKKLGLFMAEEGDRITLDLGKLESKGTTGDVTSETTVTGSASVFDLTKDQLKQMADTDNALKHVVNYYANFTRNTSDSTIRYYNASPAFGWKSSFSTVKNQWSNPDSFPNASYSISIASNDPKFTYADFCNANPAKQVAIVPPTTILQTPSNQPLTLINQGTPSEDLSIGNAAEGRSPSCSLGSLILSEFKDPSTGQLKEYWLNFNDAKMASNAQGGAVGIPEGLWKLRIDGVDVADFDLAVANPYNSEGKSTIYVPALKVDVDPVTNEMTKFAVKWFYWDKDAANPSGGTGSYAEITDTTVLRKTVGELIVYWTAFEWPTAGQRSEEYFSFGNGFENKAFEKKWYAPGTTQDAAHPVVGRITAQYQIGGVSYSWTWN